MFPTTSRSATIRSNPPIRVGKNELHGLLERWIPRLDERSDAWLVVQRNLGSDSLQRWLAATLRARATACTAPRPAAASACSGCAGTASPPTDPVETALDGRRSGEGDLARVDERRRPGQRDVLARRSRREHPHPERAAGHRRRVQRSGAPAPAQCRTARAAAATPVPQLRVSPTPRSNTRMRIEPTPSVHERVARHDELDVRAVRRHRVAAAGATCRSSAVELVASRQRDDDVRIADVDARALAAARARPRARTSTSRLVDAPAAEVDLEAAGRAAGQRLARRRGCRSGSVAPSSSVGEPGVERGSARTPGCRCRTSRPSSRRRCGSP